MFQVYAATASILLPTGLIGVIYFLSNFQTNKKPFLWSVIIECTVTVFLGIFYTYCAIILSEERIASDVNVVNNNIDDLAIINDTFYSEIGGTPPIFYNKNQSNPLDQTPNEVEDTRNSINHQSLIETAVGRKIKNDTKEGGGGGGGSSRTLYQRRLFRIKKVEEDAAATTDSLGNQDCFRRAFFYRALFVYSFISCAISLLNTCHFCKQCSAEDDERPAWTTQEPKREENPPSETFGEKILDISNSDNSSQNDAAPVGPLFQENSLDCGAAAVATPLNLDVFTVKKISQLHTTTAAAAAAVPCSGSTLDVMVTEKGDSKMITTTGKCLITLILPPIFVIILYFAMISGGHDRENQGALPERLSIDFLHNFNVTPSTGATGHDELDKTFSTAAAENVNEVDNILRRVYAIIDKIQEERKSSNDPVPPPTTVRGHYLHHSNWPNGNDNNSTESSGCCLGGDKTNLKTFHLTVFVVLFLLVIFYAKLSATKLPENPLNAARTLTKCTLVFLALWTPGILDTVVSTLITDKEPNSFSSLLVLVGNLDRLYSTVQNIASHKRWGYGKGIKPAFK